MPEQIKLQQALFGYRDGHNLLATSATLAPRVRQFLATMTDSSGPENNKAFQGTFTGLPVPETDLYALFCTWAAPEMSRPGCVWSHVILIQLADFARIPGMHVLGNLCSRPSIPIDMARYEQPLVLDFSKISEHVTRNPDPQRFRYLVRTLYEHPEAGVVILDNECAPWEDAVFAVWAQQWPRLRREFTFSTGSLGDRRLTGIQFDLQIAPISSERLWRRAGVPTFLLNYRAQVPEAISKNAPQWIDVVEDDLCNATDRQFRLFLLDYGSDIGKPRAAFAKLAAVYKQLGTVSGSSWANLLLFVGESFPVPTEAVRLKRWLMSLPLSLTPSERLERAWETASFLLTSEQSAAYPVFDFDFVNSAVLLWKERREQTISLLTRLVQRENESAVSFAKGIAGAINSASLKGIAEGHGELVPIVIRHNPALAFEIDTWKLSGHIQTQVYEVLTTLSLCQQDWGRIVGAMFIAATYVAVRDAVEMAGQSAMSGAFRWLEYPVAQEVLPSLAWRDALAAPAIAMLNQARDLQPAQLALTAWCAPIDEVCRVLYASREDVRRLADESPEAIPAPLRVPTAFLLLTLGLIENSDQASNLILRNFFTVHDALASGEHSSESWWLLSPVLPSLGWWRDWDRCKKLQLAVNWYLAQHGGNHRLIEFATSPKEQKIARKVTGIDSDDTSSEFID